ncbi:hypothetical protein ACWGB8_02030 [Kitasatospora sp. NPDC054939]
MAFRVAEGYVEVTMNKARYEADKRRLLGEKLSIDALVELDDAHARTQLATLARPLTVQVRAQLDDAAIRARIEELSREIQITVDDSAARASLDALARERVAPIMAVVDTAQAHSELQQLAAPLHVAVVPTLHVPTSQEVSDYISNLQPLLAAAAGSAAAGTNISSFSVGPSVARFITQVSQPIEIPITARIGRLAQFRVNRWRRQTGDDIRVSVSPEIDEIAASTVESRLTALHTDIRPNVSPEWESTAAALVQAHIQALQDPVQVPVEPNWDSTSTPVIQAELDRLRETIEVTVKPEWDDTAGQIVAAHLDIFRLPVDVPIRPVWDQGAATNVQLRLRQLASPLTAAMQAEIAQAPYMLAGTLLDRLARRRTAQVDVRVEQSQVAQVARLGDALTQSGSSGRAAAGGLSVAAGGMRLLMVSAAGAIPTVVALGQAIVSMGPAAAVAAPALGSLISIFGALKVGLGGVGGAFKAAFAPAAGGGGAAVDTARQVADAHQQLKLAIRDSADANRRAIQQVTTAERDLATAQRQERQAQLDLIAAREDAAEQLQDYQARLAGAELDHRQALLDVEQAKQDLDKTLADPTATDLQRRQAQLAADQAVQGLQDQETAQARLRAEAARATAAGVDGNARVAAAAQDVADAQQDVQDRTLALSEARISADRAAEDGALRVAQAQQAIADAMKSTAAGAAGAADAMAKLAPAAREFVEAVLALAPAWNALRLDVQQALFEGIGARLTTVARQVLPDLQTGLVGTATVLNQMGLNALTAVDNLSKTGTLKAAFASINDGLAPLQQVPAQLLTMFGQVTAAAAPAFQRITSAVGEAVGSFGARLSESFSSGQLTETINAALGLVRQFGSLLADVAGTFGNILKAAGTVGGDALGLLSKGFEELRKVTGSPEMQAALQSLFRILNQVAATVVPLFGQALMALGPVVQALEPGVVALVKALGVGGLQPVIAALGPVLTVAAQAVSQFAIACVPLINLAGQLIAGALPAAVPLFTALSSVMTAAAPVVAALAKGLSDLLMPVLAELPSLTEPISKLMSEFAIQVLPLLAEMIKQLPLKELGEAFVEIAVAAAPLLEQLAILNTQLLAEMVPLLLPVIAKVGELAAIFATQLAGIISNVVVPALQLFSSLLRGDVDAATKATKELIKGLITESLQLFVMLPIRVAGALWDLGGALARAMWDAFMAMNRAAAEAWPSLRDWFSRLPGTIADAVGDLGRSLYNAGSRVISGLIDGINSKLQSLRNVLSNVTDLMPKWKGPEDRDAVLLTPAGQAIMDGLLVGIGDRLPALRSMLQGVTAEVGAAQFGSLAAPAIGQPAGGLLPAGAAALAPAPALPSPAAPTIPAPQGTGVKIETINITGSFDLASPAERRAIAEALVVEINGALRDYDRGRAQ